MNLELWRFRCGEKHRKRNKSRTRRELERETIKECDKFKETSDECRYLVVDPSEVPKIRDERLYALRDCFVAMNEGAEYNVDGEIDRER